MKIKPTNYTHGGWGLEIVAETPVEFMILTELWKFGELDTGNGESVDYRGLSNGFYIKPKKEKKADA